MQGSVIYLLSMPLDFQQVWVFIRHHCPPLLQQPDLLPCRQRFKVQVDQAALVVDHYEDEFQIRQEGLFQYQMVSEIVLNDTVNKSILKFYLNMK